MPATYRHTQRAPLCLLIYTPGIILLIMGFVLHNEPGIRWIFPIVGTLVVVLAASFHHLTAEDGGDQLSIAFGPVPLFRRTIRYEDIESVELDRTTLIEGWGIHLSPRGGWVWNLWGRDCIALKLKKGTLRIGTDDPEGLTGFLNERSAHA